VIRLFILETEGPQGGDIPDRSGMTPEEKKPTPGAALSTFAAALAFLAK